MKKFLSYLILISMVMSLCACGKKDPAPYVTTNPNSVTEDASEEMSADENLLSTEAVVITSSVEEATTESKNEPTIITTSALTEKETEKETETVTVTQVPSTTQKTVEKTGDMKFSDSPNNRYIKAIVKKYKVPQENLACLYTVPLNDSNIVMEFSGKKDANGKLIRNKDTLIAIYTIDKNLNSKRASKNPKLNEYPYGEMKVIFFATTKHIMPEFKKELDG